MTADRVVLSLPIAAIAIPVARIGYFDAEHAGGLGADIAANGQHDPIHVKRNGNAAKLHWTLVAGLHRLRGAEGIGRVEIDAIQVADQQASADELRRLELSENLDHRQRRPIERAIFMAERARLEEANDHPGKVGEARQARAARARWDAKDIMSFASGSRAAGDAGDIVSSASWRERTAAAMGCSVKTLQRYERLHRDIVLALPDLAEQLNFHPLGESFSAMQQLTALNPMARCDAVTMILSRMDWPNLQTALVAAGLRESTGSRVDQTKLGLVMMGAWFKMPLTGRRTHCEWLIENVTPGMAIDMVEGFKRRGLLP